MPQMAPMWWTTIMVLTITMMIIMISMIYFLKSPKMKYFKAINEMETNKMNWKW